MRILITDTLFPCEIAEWRLNEIGSFINNNYYDIDIINFNNNYFHYTFNEYTKKLFKLDEYNIFINKPEYNYLNIYNKDFNGKIFNHKLGNCNFIYVKKKFIKFKGLNTSDYDKIYHIFYINYILFNKTYKYPTNKQIIHLYPGGGFNNSDINTNDSKIIVTQQFIEKYILNNNIKKNILKLYGCSYFLKNEKIKHKLLINDKLNVCFTSYSQFINKGWNSYIELYKLCKENNMLNNLNFISIGVPFKFEGIKNYSLMNQNDLSKFYYNNIDIYINFSTKINDGFPIGIEAVKQGCILFTFDIHNSNILNKFFIDNFYIINNVIEAKNKINYLINNKNLILNLSIKLQEKIYELFKYENYQNKIFDFIK
jgi:hypothetical protein